MDWLPLVGLAPDQLPEAVQLVAFAEFQLSIDAAPVATVPGLAVSETDGGAGGMPTATVTVWLASPPAPEQVSVKSLVAFSAPVASEPFTALLPDQPPAATAARCVRGAPRKRGAIAGDYRRGCGRQRDGWGGNRGHRDVDCLTRRAARSGAGQRER